MPASFTRRKTVRQSITAFIAALALAPAVSVAQADYPNRPVRVYVASTAGGPLDIVTRGAANWWSRRLGQSFVVEAKPGGNQLIAIDALMREKPDGYTLLSLTSGVSTSLAQMKAAPYSMADFAPIGIICGGAFLLTTSTKLPVKTIEEFVRYAKENPGKINYGEPGVMAVDIEDLFSRLGIRNNITHVRYKGGGPAQIAVLSGEVDLILGQESLVRNNPDKLRALAYTGSARYGALPDVPTISETVLPGYQSAAWLGVVARAGIPLAIAKRLNAELLEFQKTPEAKAPARDLNMEAMPQDVDTMQQTLRALGKQMEDMIAKGIIKPE